jgi:hypothetical protein
VATDPMSGKVALPLADLDGVLVTRTRSSWSRRLRASGIPLAITQRSAAAGTVMLVERLSRYPPIGGFKGGVFVTPSMCRSSSIKVLLMDPNDRAADVPGFQVPSGVIANLKSFGHEGAPNLLRSLGAPLEGSASLSGP